MPVPADLDPAVHGEQSSPAPDDFDVADVDLDDGWDPMGRYDSTPTAASAIYHTTDTLPASCHAQLQHDHSTSAAAQCTIKTRLPGACMAQPQRPHSSSGLPAAHGPSSAAVCNGLQRFAEFPSAEARQDSDRGATEPAGMKRWSHSEVVKQASACLT